MINLERISKRFDQVKAIEDISLKVNPGEIVGLLGPNGAGKTTTLRIMAGVLPQTTGKVQIDGKNFLDHEVELKKRIGYLPENNPLYDELTVEEHLKFWVNLKNIPKSEKDEAIEFAVTKTGIAEVYYRIIGELSKGYRQRVGLSQAILGQPDILLLDEPTEGLDPNQRRDIQELLVSLKKDRTVIVSSHVLGEIAKLASRVVIIASGTIVGDDTPQNLTHAKAGQQVIEVEIEGIKVKPALEKLKGVIKVESIGTKQYRITGKSKEDLRPRVYQLAVGNKWTLLTLKAVERQLEEVFSELTEG